MEQWGQYNQAATSEIPLETLQLLAEGDTTFPGQGEMSL